MGTEEEEVEEDLETEEDEGDSEEEEVKLEISNKHICCQKNIMNIIIWMTLSKMPMNRLVILFLLKLTYKIININNINFEKYCKFFYILLSQFLFNIMVVSYDGYNEEKCSQTLTYFMYLYASPSQVKGDSSLLLTISHTTNKPSQSKHKCLLEESRVS